MKTRRTLSVVMYATSTLLIAPDARLTDGPFFALRLTGGAVPGCFLMPLTFAGTTAPLSLTSAEAGNSIGAGNWFDEEREGFQFVSEVQ